MTAHWSPPFLDASSLEPLEAATLASAITASRAVSISPAPPRAQRAATKPSAGPARAPSRGGATFDLPSDEGGATPTMTACVVVAHEIW